MSFLFYVHKRVYLSQKTERRDKHLEIKFYDDNQVDDKIVRGLGGGYYHSFIYSFKFCLLIALSYLSPKS